MMGTMLIEQFTKEDIMAGAPYQQPHNEAGQTKVRKSWRSGKYTVYLWEFIYSLLQDPECCSLVAWTNRNQKEFKMVDVGEVAKLWGTIKNRPAMDDKKLLRAMRYYYKTRVLRKVKGQKGVYQFLTIPYEIKEHEQKPNVTTDAAPIPFQVGDNNGEYRERTESSSSSSLSSECTSRNGDDSNEFFMNDVDQMIDDTELNFDDVLKAIDPNMPCDSETCYNNCQELQGILN